MTTRYKALRGARDILPDEVTRWQHAEAVARQVFERYGFREIRTPLLEATELFSRSVGSSTDIVGKEMYTFTRGGESISLRPECTASVVRAFVEHALHRGVALGYPERYYYLGPMFRHERPQRGRQRQFHQIGAEVLGAPEPEADAETLQMVELFLDELGLTDRELLLASVGDPNCRPAYREALQRWLAPHLPRLCKDCQRRYTQNPLRVLDCKVEQDRKLLAEAPTILEMLCADCEAHFGGVRAVLDRFDVAYRIEPRLVRGLDYYRRTVFEVVCPNLGAQNAVLGGGRYDGLVEELGGPPMPGFGFAVGLERLVMLLDPALAPPRTCDLALVALGSEGWSACLELARRFRAAGWSTMVPLAERPLGAQLRRADRAQARFALFVGSEELARGKFGLKNLRTGEQEEADERAVLARLKGVAP